MAKTQQQTQFVGVDDGRAYTKVYAGNGVQVKVRTMVKAGIHAGSSGLGSADDVESGAYETEGQKYTIGDRVEGEDTRFEHFDGSPINRVSIHHALIRAGLGGKNLKLATGLPVSSYYFDGVVNKEAIEQKRSLLQIPVNSLVDNRIAAVIESNIVCSEALSAWLDDVLNEDGSVKAEANMTHPCGIVDFGGRTTDTLWVNPPTEIDHERSGSEQIGVLDLFDLIGKGICRKFGLTEVSRPALEYAANNGVFRYFGKDEDVTDIVETAKEEINNKIYREIQRRFGSGAELDRILFVGGGFAALPEIASRYQNAVLVKDPEFANARGMYKYLKHVENAK